mmetsp:Transcript_4206/g.10650  ORF Transcript_4206/g.10650 Transcript_4206/m.10650 type:complete len:289 (-) Transcript_4206:26-892(-)
MRSPRLGALGRSRAATLAAALHRDAAPRPRIFEQTSGLREQLLVELVVVLLQDPELLVVRLPRDAITSLDGFLRSVHLRELAASATAAAEGRVEEAHGVGPTLSEPHESEVFADPPLRLLHIRPRDVQGVERVHAEEEADLQPAVCLQPLLQGGHKVVVGHLSALRGVQLFVHDLVRVPRLFVLHGLPQHRDQRTVVLRQHLVVNSGVPLEISLQERQPDELIGARLHVLLAQCVPGPKVWVYAVAARLHPASVVRECVDEAGARLRDVHPGEMVIGSLARHELWLRV